MASHPFKTKVNKKLQVKRVAMNCDSRPENLPPPLPWNALMIYSGAPGSGKTSNLLQNITSKNKFYWKMFDKIYIFSPSLHTVKKKVKLPKERFFRTLDMEKLQELIDNADPEEHNLFIIDDLVAGMKKNMQPLITAVYNRRHIGAGSSIWIATQKMNKIPLEIRQAASGVAIFRSSKKELLSIHEDFSNIPKEQFLDIADFAFAKHKKGFLYMNLDAPEKCKYHANFDRIIFDPEDSDDEDAEK